MTGAETITSFDAMPQAHEITASVSQVVRVELPSGGRLSVDQYLKLQYRVATCVKEVKDEIHNVIAAWIVLAEKVIDGERKIYERSAGGWEVPFWIERTGVVFGADQRPQRLDRRVVGD
jgi:hypothetical protein